MLQVEEHPCMNSRTWRQLLLWESMVLGSQEHKGEKGWARQEHTNWWFRCCEFKATDTWADTAI